MTAPPTLEIILLQSSMFYFGVLLFFFLNLSQWTGGIDYAVQGSKGACFGS